MDRWHPRRDKPAIHVATVGPTSRLRRAPYSVAEPDPSYATSRAEPSWAHGLTMPDLAIFDLDKIEPFVRWFTETKAGRGVVRHWIRRAGRYRAHVESQLAAHGLPRSLEALVFVESGYSPVAHSHAGAVGLWQLMPATARALGLQIDDERDERRSVDGATTAALKHLVGLQRRFGSWELVLAAYDYGEGRLERKLRKYDVVDFWSLASVPRALPRETLEYVPKILAFALVLRNLERFGFDVHDVESPVRATRIEVPAGTPLALVAHAASTSVRTLRTLNPELTRDRVASDGGASILVPARSSARARTVLPYLIALAARGKEPTVAEDFDWGDEEAPAAALPPSPTPRTQPISPPSSSKISHAPSHSVPPRRNATGVSRTLESVCSSPNHAPCSASLTLRARAPSNGQRAPVLRVATTR